MDEEFFRDWSYVLSNGALAAIVLISILVGHPFTRQSGRETVPEQYWESPVFVKSTLVISWAWFAAFLVMTISSAITRAVPEEELWFNWVIPIGPWWRPSSSRSRTPTTCGPHSRRRPADHPLTPPSPKEVLWPI